MCWCDLRVGVMMLMIWMAAWTAWGYEMNRLILVYPLLIGIQNKLQNNPHPPDCEHEGHYVSESICLAKKGCQLSLEAANWIELRSDREGLCPTCRGSDPVMFWCYARSYWGCVLKPFCAEIGVNSNQVGQSHLGGNCPLRHLRWDMLGLGWGISQKKIYSTLLRFDSFSLK